MAIGALNHACVAANSRAAAGFGFDFGSALQLQTLFLGFVLGSLPWLWPHSGVGPPPPRA